MEAPQSPQTMAWGMQACDRCHRRKTKCDKVRPRCGPCTKGGTSCIYSEKSKERLYRRNFVERLERQNRQLEASNRALTDLLASIRPTNPLLTSNSPSIEQGDLRTQSVQTSNDIANEVSFLSTSAGGDRQFLGSASGLLLANIVRASVANSAARDPENNVSSPYSTPGLSDSVYGKPEWTINDSDLPPHALARLLVEAYLAHDHLCYPCLQPSFVREILHSIYHEPSYYPRHAFEAFTFDMVLAIATSQVHKFNWQALPDAETHHTRAMRRLDAVLSGGGLPALQAMLLLCQYRLGSSTKDNSGSLWHLVGVAARMSFEMGLHKESVYQAKNGNRGNECHNTSMSEFEQQEVRRRCFWCVFSLDRIVSITLGRPLAICLEDIDVELPNTNIGDAISPERASTSDENDLSPRDTPGSRTTIFVHIVRYRALCGKFLSSLHRSSRSVAQPESELRVIRENLALELETWRADTRSLHLPEIDLSSPMAEARSSFRSKAWYDLLYHNAILLLYRPTPILSPSVASGDIPRIFSSAKQSIKLYSYLFRSRKINFSWIVLHAVFMAGLTYIYGLSCHIREKRKNSCPTPTSTILSEDPSIVEMVNDCRACSQVLVAVSECCSAQKNCYEVFDRLSDAVLADAVDLISGSSSQKDRALGFDKPSSHGTRTFSGSNSYSSPPITVDSLGDHTFHPDGDGRGTRATQHTSQQQSDLTGSESYNSYLGPSGRQPYLATDSALQECFPDLQQIYDAQWGDDAILQLSMDWLNDIDPNTRFM